jgi:hypothetical protein
MLDFDLPAEWQFVHEITEIGGNSGCSLSRRLSRSLSHEGLIEKLMGESHWASDDFPAPAGPVISDEESDTRDFAHFVRLAKAF